MKKLKQVTISNSVFYSYFVDSYPRLYFAVAHLAILNGSFNGSNCKSFKLTPKYPI